MPVYIYHGNGLSAISAAVSNIKKSFDRMAISEFNGKNQTLEEALMSVATPGLFVESRLIILDNYPEKIDISKLTDDVSTTVVFRFSKAIPANSVFLKEAFRKKFVIREFSEADETSIFPFLDLLGEKNSRALAGFEKLYSEYGSQYLLTMLYYFYKRMVAKPKKMPDFALKKLEKQKRNFSLEQIEQLWQQTLETDFKIKSGLIDDKLGLTLVIKSILEK